MITASPESLHAYLTSFGVLSPEEIDEVMNLAKPKQLAKGEYFIRQGEVGKHVAFIQSGFFRSYYYSSKSEEVTYCFRFENSFLSAYSSFITGKPTHENMQALTDVVLWLIPQEAIKQRAEHSKNWLSLLKIIAEYEYLELEKRVFMLQKEAAEKRYNDLLVNHPKFVQLIPLSHLASYLGISQRHLSRIRKSISN